MFGAAIWETAGHQAEAPHSTCCQDLCPLAAPPPDQSRHCLNRLSKWRSAFSRSSSCSQQPPSALVSSSHFCCPKHLTETTREGIEMADPTVTCESRKWSSNIHQGATPETSSSFFEQKHVGEHTNKKHHWSLEVKNIPRTRCVWIGMRLPQWFQGASSGETDAAHHLQIPRGSDA